MFSIYVARQYIGHIVRRGLKANSIIFLYFLCYDVMKNVRSFIARITNTKYEIL